MTYIKSVSLQCSGLRERKSVIRSGKHLAIMTIGNALGAQGISLHTIQKVRFGNKSPRSIFRRYGYLIGKGETLCYEAIPKEEFRNLEQIKKKYGKCRPRRYLKMEP